MKKIFAYQIYHLLAYLLLGAVLYLYAGAYFSGGDLFLGISAAGWILFSWIAAGIFQTWILLFWRLELFYGKVSARLGRAGFPVFRAGFIVLALSAFLPLLPISFLTENTILLGPVPESALQLVFVLGTAPLILWAFYSVIRYFGVNRAFGADHFFPEYRTRTLEKRGTFKYIPNTMYTIVLLLLYYPGVFYTSALGLAAALAHHTFVWTHYFCTEKPDMKEIYGK